MQHRISHDSQLIADYAALIREGVEFPPVRVWWDGERYWLSDGFRRLAAADLECVTDFRAEIRLGSVDDALWDSYAANATHGSRRTLEETEAVIERALGHPNSARLSNVEIARHLHVTEATVRRWRKKLSSSRDEDRVRMVTRKGTTYALHSGVPARNGGARKAKTRRELKAELATMKAGASPTVRRLLAIIEHWVLGQSTPDDLLIAVERVISDTKAAGERSTAERKATVKRGPHGP